MDVNELKRQILAANKAYRDGHPIMDDQTFDDICEQLEQIIPANEYSMFRNSLNEGKGKVKHPFVMGSLDKLKREEPIEVLKFIRSHINTSLNVSAKVDGISSRAHYEDGKLVSLSSRGDGEFGEDLTDKMMLINKLPKTISIKDPIDIRGELVILKDDFAEMVGFANARNACAGLMNRKDFNASDIMRISFVAYTILGQEYPKALQFDILENNGFLVAWNTNYGKDDYSSDTIVDKLFIDASKEREYETDGLVLCDAEYKNEDKYRPYACKAFKINQQVAETTLIDVVWEGPSKDGYFVAVGIIDPVELGGAMINRVSLHNLDIMEQLGLMYGSRVVIKRSGDVIPHLEWVVGNSPNCRKIEPPTECTCCGSKLVRDGINMRCKNKSCPDQVIHRLVNFIKKLGVKSASNATLKNFGITSFGKLMTFVPNKKYKSEVKLHDELYAKVFSQSKEKLLGAMNFVGLSETSIDKIVSHYGYSLVESPTFKDEAYKSLPSGIGAITLDKFIEDLPEALAYVDIVVNDTRWHWTPNSSSTSSSKIPLKGSICVTGSLNFGSREKFLEYAEQHGYASKSGVSKGLTYLINNDVNSTSSKNKKAKELGISIISEADFIKIINGDTLECSLSDL